jgi:Uma2 family endonuclease
MAIHQRTVSLRRHNGDVSPADAWPGPGEPVPVGDLGRVPGDGHRYELLDGALVVSPAPGLPHQRATAMLCHALELACPDDLVVFLSVGVELGVHGVLGPDAVVARRSGTRLVMPPLLVAEILSPDSVPQDLNLKKAAYQRFGVPSYWRIDPDPEQPSLWAFRLVAGEYRQSAHAVGDVPFRAEEPFAVEIMPSQLVSRLRSGENGCP